MSSSRSSSAHPLAVEGRINQSSERKTNQPPLKCNAFFKWMVTILLFFSVLTSLVVSKLSLLSIALKLKPPSIANSSGMAPDDHKISPTSPEPTTVRQSGTIMGDDSQADSMTGVKYEADVAYTMLVLFMLIPHFISFFRSFIRSACSSTQLWPAKKSIIAVSLHFGNFSIPLY